MRQLKISKTITNRESQSLEKYFQEINKVDLITPEELGMNLMTPEELNTLDYLLGGDAYGFLDNLNKRLKHMEEEDGATDEEDRETDT